MPPLHCRTCGNNCCEPFDAGDDCPLCGAQLVDEALAGRLLWALRRAKLDRTTFGHMAHLAAWPANAEYLRLMARIAGRLRVDARWLLLGITSAAGAAACDFLGWPPGTLAAVQEPDRGAGCCRYCGTTADAGLVPTDPAGWVDSGRTMCASCLTQGE